jgi:subtilisin family serine protease
MDPELATAIEEAGSDALIPIFARCDQQVTSTSLYAMTNGLSRDERRRTVIIAKRSVVDAQNRALSYLRDEAQRGNATQPISTYSVNAVATKAKAAVITTLLSLPEFEVVCLDRKGVPMTDCTELTDYHICDETQYPCEGPSACNTNVQLQCINTAGQPVTIPVPLSSDPEHPSVSYALQFLGMPEVWNDFKLRGMGSLILNVDTGIDYCLPSIENRYSYNLCDPLPPNNFDDDQNGFVDDYFGWDQYEVDGDPYNMPVDPSYTCQLPATPGDHGTFCASAAVGDGSEYGDGSQNPGFGSKITGTAPGASLRSFRGQFNLGGNQSGTFRSVDYALTIGADVVTVQWLSEGQTQDVRDAIQALDAAGIVTLGAMGNALNDPLLDVPSVPEAIAVGGIWNNDPQPDRCDYTRFNHPRGPVTWPDGTFIKPDLVAPAEPVETVRGAWDCHRQLCEGPEPWGEHYPKDTFAHGFNGGTSVATPLVAGLTAIMFERNNELLPSEMKTALETTALDLGPTGKDNDFGAGVPRIAAALRSIDLVNTFDRYLTIHSYQAGGLPTNWSFAVDNNSAPLWGIGTMEGPPNDICAPQFPPPPLPRGALSISSPSQSRTVGYVWDEHENYQFTTTIRFYSDPNHARFMGLLLRWDPDTKHCVYVRTRQVIPGNPTSTEFVFGHEEPGGTGAYVTVPWSSHHFDFQDINQEYYLRVNDVGGAVSLWVGKAGIGGETEIIHLAPYTTAVPLENKGVFAADGARVLFDHVTVRNFPIGVSVEEPSPEPTAALSLSIAVSAFGVTTFKVAKAAGTGSVLLYDVSGREIRELDLPQAAGTHALQWDATMPGGRKVSSGVYFARVVAGPRSVSEKFLILR